MLTLEKIASEHFKGNLPLKMSPEEKEEFENSTICWLCEEPITEGATRDSMGENVRDHDHLTGKYRGAAHSKCNINCKQKSSSFIPIFFHNFSGYDCHLIFEQLLTQAYDIGLTPKVIPKSMENYVSVQIGCLRFLDSYRFLSAGLDKLVKSLDSFPFLDSNGFKDPIFKTKLAYPYEYITLSIFQEPLNLKR